MTILRAAFLTSALVLAGLLPSLSSFASATLAAETCPCSAADGSCSATITCTGGCVAVCGNNGECSAYCSGFLQSLAMETTFKIRTGPYPQLLAELARVSGKEIAFAPARPDLVLNAESKKAILWDVLEMLSDRGTVEVAGRDFEKLKRLRGTMVSGEKISLCVRATSVSTFTSDMTGLTGVPLRIVSGRPMATVSVKLHDVTFDEALVRVSEQTGTRIIVDSVD